MQDSGQAFCTTANDAQLYLEKPYLKSYLKFIIPKQKRSSIILIKYWFILCVTDRIRCRGASCWLIIWSSRRCMLLWAWTAAEYAALELHRLPKTLWITSWAWTSLWKRCMAWVKAVALTPSPSMNTASQGRHRRDWSVGLWLKQGSKNIVLKVIDGCFSSSIPDRL